MTDSPGAWNAAAGWFVFFEEDFMTWAVCAKGKEAGSSYGSLHWGIRAHTLARGRVSIWLAGARPSHQSVAAGISVTLRIP